MAHYSLNFHTCTHCTCSLYHVWLELDRVVCSLDLMHCVYVFDGSAHFAWFQISYASSVSLEVSRDSLPFYYQLLPTEANYIPAVASIISCYGWMQFTIISEDEHVFLDVSEGMIVLYLFF